MIELEFALRLREKGQYSANAKFSGNSYAERIDISILALPTSENPREE